MYTSPYQGNHYMGSDAYWEMGGDYYGTFKGSYEWYHARTVPSWRAKGETAGGLLLGGVGLGVGIWAGAKAGAALGGLLGTAAGPIGTAIGAIVGTALGAIGGYFGTKWGGAAGAALAGGWTDLRYSFLQGHSWKEQDFTMPFVNTHAAATMRQASMQSMMMSTNNYRTVLGREANRLHR